ncbi:MAG: response regulator transcription factor [Lachnospiraceae bacterium]|jgi:two component transcriptional regulator, winged helix family
MNRILLVEDDKSIVESLSAFLVSEGFTVDTANGQKKAVGLIEEYMYDILLVDISLADGNGFAVCMAAKEKGYPVIFLTASGDEYSVVAGLDMGADDYIAKPFRPRELVSRIKSVQRRYAGPGSIALSKNVNIYTDRGVVVKDGKEVLLSALEYRLLLVFVNNRGNVMSRNRLLEEIWDVAGDFVNDNTLTVYIKRLREKIEENPSDPQIIKTIRGLGYRLD